MCNILHILQYIIYIAHTLLHLPKPAQLLETHLAQVLFDSGRDVASSLRDEAEQTPQLVDPELQRFSLPCLEGLPGPLYGQLFPGHLTHRTNNRCQSVVIITRRCANIVVCFFCFCFLF